MEQPSRWAFQFSLLMRAFAGPMADWLQVMLRLFVFIYEVLPKSTYEKLWGCRGIIQHWDLFTEIWTESTVNVLMMLAPRGTSGLFNMSREKRQQYLASSIREEQYPTLAWNNNLSNPFACEYVLCVICENNHRKHAHYL